MKFIHQLLKNKRLLIHVKGQSIKQYFATEKGNSITYRATKKAHATLFKKNSTNVVRTTFFAINRVGCSVTFTYIYTIHLNKSASKKSLF